MGWAGNGEAPHPAVPSPLGQGPGPFRGWGHPNTSLRLSGCLCLWCSESGMPLISGTPSGTLGPLGMLPLALQILKYPWFQNPPSAAGVMGPLLSASPPRPPGGREGMGRGLRSPLLDRGGGGI